jgi:hypothetical protein
MRTLGSHLPGPKAGFIARWKGGEAGGNGRGGGRDTDALEDRQPRGIAMVPRNRLRRSPNGAIMAGMVARLCVVVLCLPLALLGGCSSGSQAPKCIPGASAACSCPTGQQGAQTCNAAGTADAAPDLAISVGPEAQPDTRPVNGPEAGPEAAATDLRPMAGPEAGPEALAPDVLNVSYPEVDIGPSPLSAYNQLPACSSATVFVASMAQCAGNWSNDDGNGRPVKCYGGCEDPAKTWAIATPPFTGCRSWHVSNTSPGQDEYPVVCLPGSDFCAMDCTVKPL